MAPGVMLIWRRFDMRFRLNVRICIACGACLAALSGTGATSTNPQVVPEALSAGFESIRAETLRADLTFLASDALQGRMSMQPGDEAAIQWVASEFAKAGLTPPVNGSYLQPVDLVEFRADRERSYLTVDGAANSKQWKYPEVVASFPSDLDVTADVVFAGFGITAPELNYDDYQGIDVHGKIVLIFDHEPQERDAGSIFNGTGNTRYATTRIKVLNAQAHGAAGVLIAGEPNRKHPSNQERVARIGGSAKRVPPIASQALAGDILRTPSAVVSDQVGAEILARAGASPFELQMAIDRDLKPQSRPLPDTRITLHYRNSSEVAGKSGNVVGLLEGRDPQLKAETILISAHHDHDGMNGSEIWHGADDNGSGTVGVVALAHAFMANARARNGRKPERSILFVVFASEERGLLGSFHMAADPVRPLETTRAMINFDMIGRNETESEQTKGLIQIPPDTTNRLNLIGAVYSPDYNRTVEEWNKYVGLDLDHRFDHEAALNILFRSDQFPFLLRNVPALWWFTGFHPDYHHTTDTADRINYRKMEKILKLAYLSAYAFAGDTAPPKFLETPRGEEAGRER
jgi:hypothetical protein